MNYYTTTDGVSRRKLTDILNGGSTELQNAWANAEAAREFAPLPAGSYTCRIVSGELTSARSGTPGYKLTFRVLEGEHAGRQIWLDVWLTAAALPLAKRDLAKLGITSLEQLEKPLPAGIRANVKVAQRKSDDGTEYNRVRTFHVLGRDKIEDDDFSPVEPPAPSPREHTTDAATPGVPLYEQLSLFPLLPPTRSAQAGGK